MLDKQIPFKERKRNRDYAFRLADRNIFREEIKDAERLIKEKVKWLGECNQK